MTAEVVNLRRARKARDRTIAETQAAANRVAFGRTRAEKIADADARTRIAGTLDGAKRER